MSADKDRGIRRQKQKREKDAKKLRRQDKTTAVAARSPVTGAAAKPAA